MTNRQIFQIVLHYKGILKPYYTKPDQAETEPYHPHYSSGELHEFIHDLTETANRAHIILLENHLPAGQFAQYVKEMDVPLLAFVESSEGETEPVSLKSAERGKWEATYFKEDGSTEVRKVAPSSPNLVTDAEGNILFMAAIFFDSLVSEPQEEGGEGEKLSPVTRFFRLLSTERKDIIYIYIFAIFGGIISLALPLGIQAIIGLISGGLLFSSVVLLIAGVILAVLLNGGLQIMQLSMVEVLQRRIFTKAAYEFSFRIPRIKAEAILKEHLPELMNRFFDVLTIQKGLPKLLIDFSSSAMQIFFGLILLAFYHPFFVFFGLFLLFLLFLIFYLTGPKGLKTSITESKYKYKVVYWLEEMGRAINAFKLAGNSGLPVRRTDHNVNSYLHYREAHFNVLMTQYRYFVLFKTIITGGVLILGSILVIDRQITLGQFVASEIVIILVLNAVEKVILYLETVFDMLTAVDKIGHVTDLPLERSGGISIPSQHLKGGLHLRVKDLKYRFEEQTAHALNGLDLEVKAGDNVGITGFNQSGKSTLANILAGIYTQYEGIITINGFSYRDLDLINQRDFIAKNISQEDIFDGTILDNVGVGKPTITYPDVVAALEVTGLGDFVNSLPEGLHTHITSGGKGFPDSIIFKIILARCIAKKPKMLILNDFFVGFSKKEKIKLVDMLMHADRNWTLVVFSTDPVVLKRCRRVVVLKAGKVWQEAGYQELKDRGALKDLLNLD